MQVAYTLTLDDLVRLNRYMIQRHSGMSLWLFYLCGITLGPIGVLGLWADVSETLARHRFLWGDAFGCLLSLFFLWIGVSALWHLPANVRRRARLRVRQFPSLLEERHLVVVENGLLESAPGAIAQISDRRNTDPPATEEEIAHLHQQYAVLAVPWADVSGIGEDEHGLYIIATAKPGFIIPRRIFQDPTDLQRLREYFMDCWNAAKTGEPFPSEGAVWPPPPRFS